MTERKTDLRIQSLTTVVVALPLHRSHPGAVQQQGRESDPWYRKGVNRTIKLLTKDLVKRLPALYSQEDNPDPMVVCKFFLPDAAWTWYVTEGSPVDENGYDDMDKEKVDFLFFGLVSGIEIELGYFSLSELESVRGAFGLPVERDLYFEPVPLSEVKSLCGV
jgi:hypothetical protein